MANHHLSVRQARRFLLAHQGLWPPAGLAGKEGVLSYIHRVGCIQFDPLNIAGRNAELVLQARLAGFQPALLEELLYTDRLLLDGWDKNMSIYRREDWPFFARYRQAAWERGIRSLEAVKDILPQVRQALEERGPLSSLDLDYGRTVDWWWAPTRLSRATLESMYFWGELVIHHKLRTRKVYDFARRHLPAELLAAPDPNPADEQYADWRVRRRVGGIGLLWNRSGDAWLGISGLKSRDREQALNRLAGRGELRELTVEGFSAPFYLRAQDAPALEAAEVEAPPRASIIAPLDNLLWDRRLIQALFGFVYTWEVYKPAADRRHGYYVLPVLYGDRFIARFEPGREKESGDLVIKNWWWEPEFIPSKRAQAALRTCFRRFLSFLGAGHIRIDDRLARRENLRWLNTGRA